MAFFGIVNASTKSVQDLATAIPSVARTVRGRFRPITLGRVQKRVQHAETIEAIVEEACLGVLQPFSSKDLLIKPEGQRAWSWTWLHTTSDTLLKDDDEVIIKGIRYRVLGLKDWSDYGVMEYQLHQGFQNGR